ncbi:unnamed protein product [Periconia digitata]|uniref:Flavin-containing monooxygenase n=1 Tax=Periconia digitata TaxID=1303443 RepID=A0A9W4ULR9_9PLEO|nr:unnamed protein product [Periconia digitata]
MGAIQHQQPWPQAPVGNKDHTQATVVIIGAGFSGVCMAIDLIKRNQCHNFIILERSSGVGGTWNDNKYPGCCCDVWSILYSYSFEQNPDWSREYPGQEEILDYLRNVAQKYQLYKYIRFNSSVEAASWNDGAAQWKVDVKVTGEKDSEFSPAYSIQCDFLVSAVGQLNQPHYPDIEGLEDFKGKVMHSARWDWSYNLEGKRIGVIGNGATAAQIIPEIVPTSESVTVYQRTPNWVVPRLDGPISSFRRFLYRYVPPIRWRGRALSMDYREQFYHAVTDSQSPHAQLVRTECKKLMEKHFPGRPDMWEKLLPNYSPGCKRVIICDDYYPAIASPKSVLETDKIVRIDETGVQVSSDDGEIKHHDHDLLVLATGFRSVQFLYPLKITGAGGRPLTEIWEGGASALYGTTVPDLPNFGIFYGPNTNLGHNSIVLMIEAQSRYLNGMVKAVLDARDRGERIGIIPKKSRTDEFNDKIQEILRNSSFADPACNSWYKTDDGKITNNWSGTVVEYQKKMSKVDWEDYEIITAEEDAGKTAIKQRINASKVVFGDGKKESSVGWVREESVISDTGLLLGAASIAAMGTAWAFRSKLPKGLGLAR